MVQPSTPLLVSVRSRLGLIHPPYGEVDTNIGVELGSDFILTSSFVSQLPFSDSCEFSFTSPEIIDKKKYFAVLSKEYEQFIELIRRKYSHRNTLITVGGDHSISFGSLAVVLASHNPATTAVLMIDSHTDIHQPSTSPSGNFHGMWLRPFLSTFEEEKIERQASHKLSPSNLWYIGNLDAEPEEQAFISENNISTFDQPAVSTQAFLSSLEAFISSMEHVHVSLDVDVFSHKYAPATGMEIDNGFSPEEVFPILRVVSSHPSLSIDLVEVNPRMEGQEKTVELAQSLLSTILLKQTTKN